MGSRFDNLQNRMYDRVTNMYGYNATWSNKTARVLLREPTETDMINGVEYTPFHRIMEWRHGTLDGLFDAIREAASTIELVIDGKSYYAADAAAKYDGKTYKAVIYEK